MDPRYGRVYEEIFEARTAPGVSHGVRASYARMTLTDEDAELVSRAIADAEREAIASGWALRSDAKALLALNFQDLVLLPLRSAGITDPFLGRTLSKPFDLEDAVRSDIVMLVRAARADSESNEMRVRADPREISGHGIIDALSRNWERLNVSRFRLWQQS